MSTMIYHNFHKHQTNAHEKEIIIELCYLNIFYTFRKDYNTQNLKLYFIVRLCVKYEYMHNLSYPCIISSLLIIKCSL